MREAMKKLVTISTVGSFAVGVIMMLIELASIGDEMKYLATFLVTFVVSFATIFSSLLLAREVSAQKKAKSELNDDVSRLKPIHLEMLRILLDERTLVLNDDFRNSVDYLVYNGFVGRISPDKITFTKKGKEVALKLEKEGRL